MEQAQKLPDFADIFERLLVPAIFDRYARDLVERARPFGPSDRILDLGCGTGIVARVLRERLGGAARLTGLDVNAEMLAKARSIAPEIEWIEGNAAALPFADRSFEVVLAQQVLQFVPDRLQALGEIRRVLVPGGRLIASTWRPREHQPLFGALGAVAEKHLGAGNDKRWTLDGDALSTLLASAGFTDIQLDTASLEERHAMFPIQASTSAAGYTNVDTASMAAIEAESKAILARHTATDGTITNRSVTNVAIARVA
ncbi:MAG TPA: methyltransferase domain-containing protein [Kofleriaceae bacterium]|nr:methyltransferase domain-containing protein [Kofleriaceae bacterium]